VGGGRIARLIYFLVVAELETVEEKRDYEDFEILSEFKNLLKSIM
jgi:hypothetical protein